MTVRINNINTHKVEKQEDQEAKVLLCCVARDFEASLSSEAQPWRKLPHPPEGVEHLRHTL